MNIDQAKKKVYDATADGAQVEACIQKTFVRMFGEETVEPIYIDALHALHRDGALVQVASAGQSRSTVAYRRADKPFDVTQIK